MVLRKNIDFLEVLKQTSRTFYIPISRLPSGLQEAVSYAYLCFVLLMKLKIIPT